MHPHPVESLQVETSRKMMNFEMKPEFPGRVPTIKALTKKLT